MSDQPSDAELGETVILDETHRGKFQVEAKVGATTLLVDEPVAVGGLGSGPNPYDLLSTALGSCTLMTVRLYAERKAWPLERVRVRVRHHRAALQAKDVFTREILLEGDLTGEQKTRLMEIAERCPVHLTLERGSDVTTTLLTDPNAFGDKPNPDCEHMTGMDEACGY